MFNTELLDRVMHSGSILTQFRSLTISHPVPRVPILVLFSHTHLDCSLEVFCTKPQLKDLSPSFKTHCNITHIHSASHVAYYLAVFRPSVFMHFSSFSSLLRVYHICSFWTDKTRNTS